MAFVCSEFLTAQLFDQTSYARSTRVNQGCADSELLPSDERENL